MPKSNIYTNEYAEIGIDNSELNCLSEYPSRCCYPFHFNGSTFNFEKFDSIVYEGSGSFTTADTKIHSTNFISEVMDFATQKTTGV